MGDQFSCQSIRPTHRLRDPIIRLHWVSFIYYEEFDHYRIGYILDESIWGRGLGTLCCKKGCEYWFQEKFGIDRIETYTYHDNLASQKILMKCGFEKSGRTLVAKRKKWDAELDDFSDGGDFTEELVCDIWTVGKTDFENVLKNEYNDGPKVMITTFKSKACEAQRTSTSTEPVHNSGPEL